MAKKSSEENAGRTPWRAAIAAWVGSALEYYDFAIYGTAAALIINKLFFPPDAPVGLSVLFAMGTVGVAYVVRPLGSLVTGPLADRFGRRFVLLLTLFLMGGATFAVGLLPTYEEAGWLAPALLVLCRVVQGLSASGEQASAISVSLEHAHDNHRALTTSWTLHGTQFGTLLAVLVFIPFTVFLSDDALRSWGWRVPFWFSAVIILIAYVIRRKLEEPPSFEALKKQTVTMSPLAQTVRFHLPAVVRVAIAALINTVNMVFTVWSISFARNGMHMEGSAILWVPVAANVVALGAVPAAGWLADRIGRKTIFILGVLGSAVFMYPYLWSITQGIWPLVFLFGILMSGLLYSGANAVWPAFYAEMFPTRVRVTGLALGTQIGFALSGGLAPVLATLAAGEDMQSWFGPAVFVTCACLVSAVAALTARETAHLKLTSLDTVHISKAERARVYGDIDSAPS